MQAKRNDPYFELNTINKPVQVSEIKPEVLNHTLENKNSSGTASFSATDKSLPDPNEELVNQKLEQLYKEINKNPEEPLKDNINMTKEIKSPDHQFTTDIDRLEQMMHLMNSGSEEDPELSQLHSMLEKILDIQHPDRVTQKIREQSLKNQKKVFPVLSITEKDEVTLLEPKHHPFLSMVNFGYDSLSLNFSENSALYGNSPSRNGFYGLEDDQENELEIQNAIEAVIHETQIVVNGSIVKLRILNDVFINGKLIPKDHFIYGFCQINKERLFISIPSIKHEQAIFPVALTAYDLDGMEGIHIPGAMSRDVAKQASDQAVQGINLYSFDPSIAAQATSAGINAAKGLLSKKAKLIKVTIKAGYRVLLADMNY
jgi:conjugative transposon TraM protein